MQQVISSRRAVAMAALVAATLLAGCLSTANRIRFEAGSFGPEFVPGQVVSALENVGYRQVAFKDFRTFGAPTRWLRVNGEQEARFVRRGTPTFIAQVYFEERRHRVIVVLTEDGQGDLSPVGQKELELVRASLRETFGPTVVP